MIYNDLELSLFDPQEYRLSEKVTALARWMRLNERAVKLLMKRVGMPGQMCHGEVRELAHKLYDEYANMQACLHDLLDEAERRAL